MNDFVDFVPFLSFYVAYKDYGFCCSNLDIDLATSNTFKYTSIMDASLRRIRRDSLPKKESAQFES